MAFNDDSFQQLKKLYADETGNTVNTDNFDSFAQYVQAHQLIVIYDEIYKLANKAEDISDKLDNFIDSK